MRMRALRKRYGRAAGDAAKLRAMNLRVRRMPGGRYSVFAARGLPTFYHTFGPGPGSREQAVRWAAAFALGKATSPYGVAYRP